MLFAVVPGLSFLKKTLPSKDILESLWPPAPDSIWSQVSERIDMLGVNGICVCYGALDHQPYLA